MAVNIWRQTCGQMATWWGLLWSKVSKVRYADVHKRRCAQTRVRGGATSGLGEGLSRASSSSLLSLALSFAHSITSTPKTVTLWASPPRLDRQLQTISSLFVQNTAWKCSFHPSQAPSHLCRHLKMSQYAENAGGCRCKVQGWTKLRLFTQSCNHDGVIQ